MNRAYVDTTIIADCLLKSGSKRDEAERAIKCFDSTKLPVYAIKEFSSGPLKYFVWMHNKLAQTGSFEQSITALHGMSRSPRRYWTSTAMEALQHVASEFRSTLGDLVERYGPAASPDNVLADQYRYSLNMIIYKAWHQRRHVTSLIVEELDCYIEEDPTEQNGLIELNSTKCSGKCSVAARLQEFRTEIKKVMEQLKDSEKNEERKRYQALRHIWRKPGEDVSSDKCRHFGDAVFAILAPKDATLLTTNKSDFERIAGVLGKNVATPSDVIEGRVTTSDSNYSNEESLTSKKDNVKGGTKKSRSRKSHKTRKKGSKKKRT